MPLCALLYLQMAFGCMYALCMFLECSHLCVHSCMSVYVGMPRFLWMDVYMHSSSTLLKHFKLVILIVCLHPAAIVWQHNSSMQNVNYQPLSQPTPCSPEWSKLLPLACLQRHHPIHTSWQLPPGSNLHWAVNLWPQACLYAKWFSYN